MGDLITLDVVERPAAGVLRTVRSARGLRAPGLRAAIPLGTAHFVTGLLPGFTPRRVGLLAVWAGDTAPWSEVVAPLLRGGGEHWHVEGEVVRAAFSEPWRGWTPDVAGAQPLADDEPALILIAGDLRARHLPAFVRSARRAVAHAFDHPGYLGGLAVASSPLNTTSCSAWRTYAHARDYAYARGGRHQVAMAEDKRRGHHRTEWFSRVRPLAERGTLDGRAVFGGSLERVAA